MDIARTSRLTAPFVALLIAACSGATVSNDPGGRPDVVIGSAPASGETTAHELGIPPGHLPPPGSCRIWMPGRPPGHQPASGACDELAHRVPAGGWLIYRPAGRTVGHGHGKKDKRVVRVTVFGDGGPALLRVFDIATGRLLSEEPAR